MFYFEVVIQLLVGLCRFALKNGRSSSAKARNRPFTSFARKRVARHRESMIVIVLLRGSILGTNKRVSSSFRY